jgi:hypothetical protein
MHASNHSGGTGIPHAMVLKMIGDLPGHRGFLAPVIPWTAATTLILARVFGTEFWLNVQRRSDLWEAMHSPAQRQRTDVRGR